MAFFKVTIAFQAQVGKTGGLKEKLTWEGIARFPNFAVCPLRTGIFSTD